MIDIVSLFSSKQYRLKLSNSIIGTRRFLTANDTYINMAKEELDVTDYIGGYNHTINSFGGYDQASITLNAPKDILEKIFVEDVGKHFVVISPEYDIIYEGVLNVITYNIGSVSVVRGPLMDVANRVVVLYAPILDIAENIIGERQASVMVQDSDSIFKYGIFEKVLSGGQALQDYIEQARDLFLSSRKNSQTSEQQVSLNPEGAEVSMELQFIGYYNMLDAYYHNDSSTDIVQVSTKIESVLDADPNSLFTDAYNREIEFNGVLTYSNEKDYRSGLEILKNLNVVGNSSFERTIITVMNNRKLTYKSIPSTIKYYYKVTETGFYIEDEVGNIVMPWEVKPANWLYITDILVGRIGLGSVISDDPRYIFIESVNYSAPWNLEINGSKVGTFSQLIAQYGLGGLSS